MGTVVKLDEGVDRQWDGIARLGDCRLFGWRVDQNNFPSVGRDLDDDSAITT